MRILILMRNLNKSQWSVQRAEAILVLGDNSHNRECRQEDCQSKKRGKKWQLRLNNSGVKYIHLPIFR